MGPEEKKRDGGSGRYSQLQKEARTLGAFELQRVLKGASDAFGQGLRPLLPTPRD